MRPIKAIQLRYEASAELASLFDDFRLMCNDAIRIASEKRPKSRFTLIEAAYPRLKEYGLHTHYILSACEVAFAAYTNRNRKTILTVKKAFFKLYSQSYSLNHLILKIPTRPRQFILLILHASDYHLSLIEDPTLKRALTVTDRTVSIAVSKAAPIESVGSIGVDINERNVTVSDTWGMTETFDTSRIAEIKDRYRMIRAKIGERTKQDCRISKNLYAKYGKRERNRTVQAIHLVSKKIVERAKENHLGIVMEKLKGIRRLYRRGTAREHPTGAG